MSLSRPAALGPTSPSLRLLAALFQNPVRLKGQHSIFLREKRNSRDEGCRVSTGLGLLGANKGRGQLFLLWHPLYFPSSSPMVLGAEGDTIRGASSLLSPAPFALQTRPQAQGCPGGVGLHNHPAMLWKMPASCLPLHMLQRQLRSDRGFPARFIFMQAYIGST